MKSELKNVSNVAPALTTASPKTPRVTCLKDFFVVSMNSFKALYNISFDVPPETKSIEAFRNVLQELEIVLQQIDYSAKITHHTLTLEKDLCCHVALPEMSIEDTAYMPKFLSKLTKFFPQCKPKTGKPCA